MPQGTGCSPYRTHFCPTHPNMRWHVNRTSAPLAERACSSGAHYCGGRRCRWPQLPLGAAAAASELISILDDLLRNCPMGHDVQTSELVLGLEAAVPHRNLAGRAPRPSHLLLPLPQGLAEGNLATAILLSPSQLESVAVPLLGATLLVLSLRLRFPRSRWRRLRAARRLPLHLACRLPSGVLVGGGGSGTARGRSIGRSVLARPLETAHLALPQRTIVEERAAAALPLCWHVRSARRAAAALGA
mmetsp:Transcript_21284/g.54515  ORF Transcript_21284/g.54515 Transcript_21284/m.54515 type:complete len:245 (-) Transcript_21284:293-1027(-)